jgi:translocation and assembly module TamB
MTLLSSLAGVVHVEADDIDVAALAPSAPSSSLSGAVDVSAHSARDGTLRGDFTVSAVPGVVSKQHTPAASMRGSFEWRRGGDAEEPRFALDAHGTVAEPGAPTDVSVELRAAKRTTVIEATTHTVVARLSDVKRITSLGPGRADVAMKGSLVLGGAAPRVDAGLEATIDGVAQGDLAVAALDAAASVHGPLGDPTIEASVEASDVHDGSRAWSRVLARTSGSLRNADVSLDAKGTSAPDVRGGAHVEVARDTTITDVDVTVARDKDALHAVVSKITFGAEGFFIQDAEIAGAGAPLQASLSRAKDVVGVRAESEGFDLGVAARVLDLEDKVHGGTVALDVDMQARNDGADGRARIDLTNGAFDSVSALGAHVEATMEGREVDVSARAEVPGLGFLTVSQSHVHIGGKGPLDRMGWRRAFGRVHLDAVVDLARAKETFAPDTQAIGELGGTLLLTAHVSRRSETDEKPDVKLSLSTRGLFIAGRGPPNQRTALVTITTPTWKLRGLEAALDAQANGSSDFAELSARVNDARGPLVVLDAKSTEVPYDTLFEGGSARRERLLHLPISARVLVPRRRFADLPDVIRPEAANGAFEIEGKLDGSVVEPSMVLDASASDVRFTSGPRETPYEGRVHATYDGKTADATVDVGSPSESFVHAVARANADAKQLLSGAPNPAWNGSARATLYHFPLGSVAALADRNVRARASGEVVIEGLHEDPRLSASLAFDNLRIGRARYTKAIVDAKFDGSALGAHARIEQKDGFADAQTTVPLVWGKALVPSLDANGATTAELHAKSFRAAFLEPFLSSAIDTIDGLVDADAKLSLAPETKPEMTGAVTLRDGRVDISALGEELHGVSAKMTFSPDGTVKVQDLVAFGTTGKMTGEGSARLDGTSLVEAAAKVEVKKGEAIPLAVSGSNMGTVFGRVELRERTDVQARRANMELSIPELHVVLPDATPHSVQDLDPQPDSIHIGVSRAPHEFTVLEPTGEAAKKEQKTAGGGKATQSPNALAIALKLGDVEIRRGTDLAVTLGGTPSLLVAEKTTMKGEIVLKQGKLDVQGKSFQIQKGTATFVDDPSNPEVNVTATWKAPDGTEVFADYLGPLKTGKVTLRSEPPRPQNEIVALIMFGTATGSQATPYSQSQDTATAAGTAVGAFAAGGLNKGIDKLTGMRITAKVDTGPTNPRPEVEVQISRAISLELAFVLGTPPPGQNPDTTYATIDWRFVRNWSLATTVGNQGSTMADVLWRYRY